MQYGGEYDLEKGSVQGEEEQQQEGYGRQKYNKDDGALLGGYHEPEGGDSVGNDLTGIVVGQPSQIGLNDEHSAHSSEEEQFEEQQQAPEKTFEQQIEDQLKFFANGPDITEAQILQSKYSLVVMFAQVYMPLIATWREEYAKSGTLWNRKSSPDSCDDNEKRLRADLNAVTLCETLEESAQKSFELIQSPHLVNNMYTEFDNLVDSPDFSSHKYFNQLSMFKALRHHIYAMELHLLEKEIRELSTQLHQKLNLNVGLIAASDIDDVVKLIGKTADAYVLSKKHHELNGRTKAQYFDDVMGGCLEGYLSTYRAEKSLELFDQIVGQVEFVQEDFDGIQLFSTEFFKLIEELYGQTGGYGYDVDYSNGNMVANLYAKTELKKVRHHHLELDDEPEQQDAVCVLKDMPRLERDYQAWQDYKKKLETIIGKLESNIDAAVKQIKSREEDQLLRSYRDLKSWQVAMDIYSHCYQNDRVLASLLQNADDKIALGVEQVKQRVQKVTDNITKNLKALSRASGPVSITKHLESYKEKLESLKTMQVQVIASQETSVDAVLNDAFQAFHLHLQTLLDAHHEKLRLLHKRLDNEYVQNNDPVALEKLLEETKTQFETQTEFLKATNELCAIFGYHDTTQDNPQQDVEDVRANITHKARERRVEMATDDLDKVVQELLGQLRNHAVNVENFTAAFDTLHIRIKALLQYKDGKSADERLSDFVALIRPYFYLNEVNHPGEYSLSTKQFISAGNLSVALEASKHAYKRFVSEPLAEFDSAKKGLLQRIADLGERVSERNEKIKTCTAVEFLSLVGDGRDEQIFVHGQFDEQGVCIKDGAFVYDKDSFTHEIMENELELMKQTQTLLQARKVELEQSCHNEIAAVADKVIGLLDKAIESEVLDVNEIIALHDTIGAKYNITGDQGLTLDQQVYLNKRSDMIGRIEALITVRVAKFDELKKQSAPGFNKEMLKHHEAFIVSEIEFSDKLDGLCTYFQLSQQFEDEYVEKLTAFKQTFEDRKFEYDVGDKIEVLNGFTDGNNLSNLTPEQVEELSGTFKTLSQMAKKSQRLSDSAKNRIGELLYIVHHALGAQYNQNVGRLQGALGASDATIQDVEVAKVTWEKQSAYQVRLNNQLVELFNYFKPLDPNTQDLSYEVKELSIDQFVVEHGVDALSAQRNLNNIGKLKVLTDVLKQAGGATDKAGKATGIKALKRLKARWEKVPADQQSVFLDVFFNQMTKIVSERLAKNPENDNQKRDPVTHKIYVTTQDAFTQSLAEQQDYLINKIVAEQSDEANLKDVVSHLQSAQKMLAHSPVAHRVKFYDNLYAELNKLEPQKVEQTKKMVLLLRTTEAANDPARKKHAKLGRATGVSRIVRRFSRPERLLKRMKSKVSDSGWIAKLIDKLLKIVQQRIDLESKKTTRHEETKQFYAATKNMYTQLSEQLGGKDSDPTPQVAEQEVYDDSQSVNDDPTITEEGLSPETSRVDVGHHDGEPQRPEVLSF